MPQHRFDTSTTPSALWQNSGSRWALTTSEHPSCGADPILVTAVPRGTKWTVRLLLLGGREARLGRYDSRSDAMAKAVELASVTGAQFVR